MKQNVYRQRKLRAADIRAFIQENADSKTYERFKKENQLDKQTEAKQGE